MSPMSRPKVGTPQLAAGERVHCTVARGSLGRPLVGGACPDGGTVDAAASKAAVRKGVRVRVPLRAHRSGHIHRSGHTLFRGSALDRGRDPLPRPRAASGFGHELHPSFCSDVAHHRWSVTMSSGNSPRDLGQRFAPPTRRYVRKLSQVKFRSRRDAIDLGFEARETGAPRRAACSPPGLPRSRGGRQRHRRARSTTTADAEVLADS